MLSTRPIGNNMQTIYEIQTNTFCDGFVNMWSDDNEDPIVFDTKEQAQVGLVLYLQSEPDENADNYRVALVNKTGQTI